MEACVPDLGDDVGLAGLRVPQVQAPSRPDRVRQDKPSPSPDWVKGEFVRGPVPVNWLSRVCELASQKTLATALALWFLAGLRKTKEDLKLTSAVLKRFRVDDRSAKSRALEALEGAGLVRVERQKGKNPLVTILEVGDG